MMKFKIIGLVALVVVIVGSVAQGWAEHLGETCRDKYFQHGGAPSRQSVLFPPSPVYELCQILGHSAKDVSGLLEYAKPYHVSSSGRREVRFYRGYIGSADDGTPYNHAIVTFEDGKAVDLSASCVESYRGECNPRKVK